MRRTRPPAAKRRDQASSGKTDSAHKPGRSSQPEAPRRTKPGSSKPRSLNKAAKPSKKEAVAPVQKPLKAQQAQPRTPDRETRGDSAFIYGRHAVCGVLGNPARKITMIVLTRAGGKWLAEQGFRDILIAKGAREMSPDDLAELLPEGSVHQGVAVLAEPLEAPALEEIETLSAKGPVIVLDQITDPQNIGAIMRSAAAFDARAVIVQDRHSPPITGALAKAAAGALELVPLIRVVNIARALNDLKSQHFFCVGLAGEGLDPLNKAGGFERTALVMGAEGAGLRPLVAKNCDILAQIPIHQQMESLNVSVAAAIAMYAMQQGQ